MNIENIKIKAAQHEAAIAQNVEGLILEIGAFTAGIDSNGKAILETVALPHCFTWAEAKKFASRGAYINSKNEVMQPVFHEAKKFHAQQLECCNIIIEHYK